MTMPIPNIDAILRAGVIPQTNPTETLVGMAWLRLHWQDYDRVEFNVPLGNGVQPWPPIPEPYLSAAVRSTQKRADIIVYRGNFATIVELKDRISGSALGQLLTYQHLLKEQNATLQGVYLIAAGTSIYSDIAPVFDSHGVTVELFPSAVPAVSAFP